MTPPGGILRVWLFPPLLLLAGYWTSGQLFIAPMPRVEYALKSIDRALGIPRASQCAHAFNHAAAEKPRDVDVVRRLIVHDTAARVRHELFGATRAVQKVRELDSGDQAQSAERNRSYADQGRNRGYTFNNGDRRDNNDYRQGDRRHDTWQGNQRDTGRAYSLVASGVDLSDIQKERGKDYASLPADQANAIGVGLSTPPFRAGSK